MEGVLILLKSRLYMLARVVSDATRTSQSVKRLKGGVGGVEQVSTVFAGAALVVGLLNTALLSLDAALESRG